MNANQADRRADRLLRLVLIGVGAVVALSVALVVFGLPRIYSTNDATKGATVAASANQKNSHCTSVQGIRWRKATSQLQVGIGDLIAADQQADAVQTAKDKIAAASAELIAVASDDNRIDSKTHPLCPYVAGRPDLTPSQPVDPTPAAVICRDGTISTSTGPGTCSHHGGIGAPR